MKVPRRTVIINLILLSTVLITVELWLRYCLPQPTYSNILKYFLAEQYVPGGFIPFTLKADYRHQYPSQEYPGHFVPVTTNRFGLRGKDISQEKPPGTKRILVIGDSSTFGAYVADDEAYPAVLQQLYEKRTSYHVEVLNAGYAGGWGPDTQYAWLLRKGFQFQPDLVIYGFSVVNDVEDIYPEGWRGLDKRGLPTEVVNETYYVDDLGRIRSKVKDWKTVGTSFAYSLPVLRESHLFVMVYRALDDAISAIIVKARWLVKPNSSEQGPGWCRLILCERTDNQETQEREKLFMKLVRGMASACQENGADFMVLMIPANFQVEPDLLEKLFNTKAYRIQRDFFGEIEPQWEKAGVKYLDLLAAMKSFPGRYFPKNGEVHCNPAGHKFTAETLRHFLCEHGWSQSSIGGSEAGTGSFGDVSSEKSIGPNYRFVPRKPDPVLGAN